MILAKRFIKGILNESDFISDNISKSDIEKELKILFLEYDTKQKDKETLIEDSIKYILKLADISYTDSLYKLS